MRSRLKLPKLIPGQTEAKSGERVPVRSLVIIISRGLDTFIN